MSTFRVSRQTYDVNSLLEKAFSDGYEYAQREFAKLNVRKAITGTKKML